MCGNVLPLRIGALEMISVTHSGFVLSVLLPEAACTGELPAELNLS